MDQLRGVVVYSKIELKSRYLHIRVKAEDIQKKTFRTRYDHCEYFVMPFGQCSFHFHGLYELHFSLIL